MNVNRHYALLWIVSCMKRSNIAVRLSLNAFQGPTVTEVYPPTSTSNGSGEEKLFSATMCIPKNKLYESIGDLRKVSNLLMDRHHDSASQIPVCHLGSTLAADVAFETSLDMMRRSVNDAVCCRSAAAVFWFSQ